MKITILDKNSLGNDTPLDILDNYGEVTVYNSTANSECIDHIGESEIIILNKVKITKKILENAKKLKLICLFATGYDNIDINFAKEKGIAVCNVPAYSTDSVALITVATVLSLYTKLNEYTAYVRSGEYAHSGIPNLLTPVYHELKGKKWGIIGYGNIGKAVAKVAEALGANVLVNKRTPDPNANCVTLETLCKESDIITLHCPLNNETRGLIDKDTISLMKKSVIIVNEARGAVTDEADIATAITKGRISAFGSDVYSTEPFTETHPFWKIKDFSNVILTPHCAWGAYEARKRCIKIVSENIASFMNGKKKNRIV